MTTGHEQLLSGKIRRQSAASLDVDSFGLIGPSDATVKQMYPTYSDAVQCMRQHRSDINVALRLLQLYPELIHADDVDPLWHQIKPHIHHQPQIFRHQIDDVSEAVTPGRKTVYVCGHSERVGEGVTAKDRIIASLSCYCRVQTHSNPPPLETNVEDALEEVRTSDVFIILLNNDTFNCWFSLYRLAGAVTFGVPIISIRDSCFELTDPLPEIFYKTEIRKEQPMCLGVPVGLRVINETRLDSSRSSGFYSTDSVDTCSPAPMIPTDCTLLSDVITNCYTSSMKYIPTFHDSCVAKLFGKLSDYLGEFFLDIEISNSHFGRVTPDTETDNSKASVYFSPCAILRKRQTHAQTNGNSPMIICGAEPLANTTPSEGNKMIKSTENLENDSPFVHRTNYMVFPTTSSPYIVAYPDGIDDIVKDDDLTTSPYGDFENVPLDVVIPGLNEMDTPPPTPHSTVKYVDQHNKPPHKGVDKTSSEHKLQKRVGLPRQNTSTRECFHASNSNRPKYVKRKTAKLPKINLQIHGTREMKKHENHQKSRRLAKSGSI